jgi:DNA-binding IclR family transcriptional regulator
VLKTVDAPPPTVEPANGSQSSLDRLLRVLDLFSVERPEWTADQIGEVMGVSRATQYRYIKSLTTAGLLAAAGDGCYRLGPRFVAMDRQIRLSDPMLTYGPPVMREACKELGHAQLLCTYFGDEVLCIHQEVVDAAIRSSMERGRPFPLFRGSPSRSILAWLPETHLRRLMLNHAHEIREVNLGSNWTEFRQKIKEIRAAGYYIGRGEIDKELMGVGVPILRNTGELAGSLTTIFPLTERSDEEMQNVISVTRAAAEQIATNLNNIQHTKR